jgi:Uma2 family endonuclease
MQKLRAYVAIGVQLVWLVDPAARCVYAYRSLTDVRACTASATLTDTAVLPGFALPLAELFADA